MKLYEINEAIQNTLDNAEIDPETGEIIGLNDSLLLLLKSERDTKIEGIIGYWKDLAGDVEKFDAEIKNLQARQKSIKNKRESLKGFLHFLHQGEKKEYGVHKIGYRRSEILKGDYIPSLPKELCQIELIHTPIRNLIKEAIKNGSAFAGWSIEERQNIQIK